MYEISVVNTSIAAAGSNVFGLMDRFTDYIQVKEVTSKSYLVCLRCFADWMQQNGIHAPTRQDILEYVRFLQSPHKRRQRTDRAVAGEAPIITMSAGTQARYLRAVKMFFKWTAQENLYPNIADNVKGAKVKADNTKRDPLQRDDAMHLLESIERSTEAGKRDYAMILLSITAGLRIIEMQRANISDIETVAKERVLFIQGKGRDEKDTYKKLTPEVYAAIQDYLAIRKIRSKSEPLFASVGNRLSHDAHGNITGRLAEPSISRIIKERMKAAGYDTHRISAHSLRHTSVTFLLEAGANIQEAQHHARHASPETTGIYAHNIDQRKSHDEQRIYNFLFGIEEDVSIQASSIIKSMNSAQQQRAIELLKAIAGQ